MTTRRGRAVLLALLALGLNPTREAQAGGPLIISRDGKPRRWGTTGPVYLNVDRGSLGGLSQPQSLLEDAMAQWNAVPHAALKLALGAPLDVDVEGLSASQFNALIVRDDGTNPVIFDNTGEIFETIFPGQGDVIIGVAGPSLLIPSSGRIVKGFALFNGRDTSRGADFFRAAMTHELGHLLNLEHSQINGLHMGRSVPGFASTVADEDVETMHPVLVTPLMKTLHADDMASLAALYPDPNFAAATGAIVGSVLDLDGVTPIQGVNVIARNAASPYRDAVSYVTGRLVNQAGSSAPDELLGAYELRGLTTGASYHISIEEVHQSFRDGASLGPLNPPRDLDPTRAGAFLERWNGVNESASNPPDDPLDSVPVSVRGGSVERGVDFLFNGVRPQILSIEPNTSSYLFDADATIQGANFAGSVIVQFTGPAPSLFQTALPQPVVINPAELLVSVPAGFFPGVYQVSALTARGATAEEDVLYTVTEPPPTVSGASPETVENHQAQQVLLLGTNLLGARSAQLLRAGIAPIELRIVRVFVPDRITVEVPPALTPGPYKMQVTNTAGTSGLSPQSLTVLELAPVLAGEVSPRASSRATAKTVRIRGANLVGTSAVELVKGPSSVPLTLVSTSLSEVVVRVPAGLEPGTYEIRITNSEGTVTGPSTFEVKAGGGGGGGGGCSTAGSRSSSALDLLVAALILAATACCRSRPAP